MTLAAKDGFLHVRTLLHLGKLRRCVLSILVAINSSLVRSTELPLMNNSVSLMTDETADVQLLQIACSLVFRLLEGIEVLHDLLRNTVLSLYQLRQMTLCADHKMLDANILRLLHAR